MRCECNKSFVSRTTGVRRWFLRAGGSQFRDDGFHGSLDLPLPHSLDKLWQWPANRVLGILCPACLQQGEKALALRLPDSASGKFNELSEFLGQGVLGITQDAQALPEGV